MNQVEKYISPDIFNSPVERHFHELSGIKNMTAKIPYVCVENFPNLGLITALRFLEWVSENPHGVISLPTGKTPEFFIKWTSFLLNNWNSDKGRNIMHQHGLKIAKKPTLSELQFVQIDEFYPINSSQKNSFYDYVMNYYINGFGLNPKKALLINSNEIGLFDE